MDNIDNLVILFDYYGELLSDSLKKYFTEYYFENLTLSEIAEIHEISRNAVSKDIKLATEKLNFYDEKLNLIKKDKMLKKIINKIDNEKIKQELNDIIDE